MFITSQPSDVGASQHSVLGKQEQGGAVRVTPTLVQAAEAILRSALDPALAGHDEGVQASLAKQVCHAVGT